MHVEGTTAPSGESSGNAPAFISLSLSGYFAAVFYAAHFLKALSGMAAKRPECTREPAGSSASVEGPRDAT